MGPGKEAHCHDPHSLLPVPPGLLGGLPGPDCCVLLMGLIEDRAAGASLRPVCLCWLCPCGQAAWWLHQPHLWVETGTPGWGLSLARVRREPEPSCQWLKRHCICFSMICWGFEHGGPRAVGSELL